MIRSMLKAKIHRATVTEADLDYEGSLSIDQTLLDQVGIESFEQVKVYNINNGARFDTYAIPGAAGSGIIGLNGAAARKGEVGDLIIIVTYALYSETELEDYGPRVVLLDENNRIKEWLYR
ncbi:MAG: aspartate 1-decarboxylase [Desulfobacterales bacterium]|nr:aspartate 1-decarboxylase [Desulfobacterales bacterium]